MGVYTTLSQTAFLSFTESIDEHFRRSLGNDYFALFAKKSPASQSTKTPSPQPQNLQIQPQQPPAAHVRTPPPPLPPSSIAASSSLPTHSALTQSAIVPPPAYPANLPPAHHQPSQQQQQQHQTQALISPKPNTVLLSPAAIAAQMKAVTAGTNSPPPLPLVARPSMQPQQLQPLALQRSASLTAHTPMTSPQSPTPMHAVKLQQTQSPLSSTAGSRTASPLPSLHHQQQQQHQQQQPTAAAMAITLSRFTSVENSPSSSPRHTPPVLNVAVPNASPTLPAIMRIKTEPGLQNVKSHNPTPPASPTSTTNPNISNTNFSSSNNSTPSPSSPSAISLKSSANTGNSSAEVLASVDDHFAKALGDTWKKLQESKEMRK